MNAKKFDAWCKSLYLTNPQIAELIADAACERVLAESVRLWRKGSVKPSLRLRPVIEKVSKKKVPANNW